MVHRKGQIHRHSSLHHLKSQLIPIISTVLEHKGKELHPIHRKALELLLEEAQRYMSPRSLSHRQAPEHNLEGTPNIRYVGSLLSLLVRLGCCDMIMPSLELVKEKHLEGDEGQRFLHND